MAQAVTVAIGLEVTSIDFSLAPGGHVSGTVRNVDGSLPLANILVQCFRIIDGRWQSWDSVTDSQGKYTIYGVPYGQFSVRAYGNNNENDYVIEYYPDKIRQSDASIITVNSDSNPGNIDFTLTTGGSISGKIISATTFEGIPYIHISVWDYDTGEWLGWAFTSTDGTYTLHGLPTGRYRIMVYAILNPSLYNSVYYNDTVNHADATPVYVTAGQDTPNINFILTPTD